MDTIDNICQSPDVIVENCIVSPCQKYFLKMMPLFIFSVRQFLASGQFAQGSGGDSRVWLCCFDFTHNLLITQLDKEQVEAITYEFVRSIHIATFLAVLCIGQKVVWTSLAWGGGSKDTAAIHEASGYDRSLGVASTRNLSLLPPSTSALANV